MRQYTNAAVDKEAAAAAEQVRAQEAAAKAEKTAAADAAKAGGPLRPSTRPTLCSDQPGPRI